MTEVVLGKVTRWLILDEVIWLLLHVLDVAAEFTTWCLRLPKQAISMYLKFQKELVLFPLRCVNQVYRKLVFLPVSCYQKYFPIEARTVQEALTGQLNPSSAQLTRAFMTLRRAGTNTVFSMLVRQTNQNHPWHLKGLKNEIIQWKQQRSHKMENLYQAAKSQKYNMKIVATVLRAIAILKNKRSKLDRCFDRNLVNMLSTNTVTAKKVQEIQKKFKEEGDDIKEKTKTCLELLARSQMGKSKIHKSLISRRDSYSLRDITVPREIYDLIGLVTSDNAHLKNRLEQVTQDKFCEVLQFSKSINQGIVDITDRLARMDTLNDEINDLRYKLDEEKKVLQETEKERDNLLDKLVQVGSLIEEAESYLDSSEATASCSCLP